MRGYLLFLFSLVVALASAKREPFTSTKAMQSKVPKAVKEACKGNFDLALSLVKTENNTESAAYVHELAREKDPSQFPPLARLYLDGEQCNGLADLFYVLAVTIKRLKDSKVANDVEFEAHTTLVTLLSDSGLHEYAERHLAKAKAMEPARAELKIRGALMTPGVYSSQQHLNDTRALLQARLDALEDEDDFDLLQLNEFVLSPTFYLVYQGLSDARFLTKLHDLYARGHPALHTYPPTSELPPFPPVLAPPPPVTATATAPAPQPLRVGFVSSHFRRHSICKLFCGVIQDLAGTVHTSSSGKLTSFQVYVFSGQDESREDKFTKQLKDSVHLFVRLSRFTVPARQEVLSRRIDVLVYLDVGMDPSTSVWAASKLAPIQMCLWGHPSTTGLRAMDYYVSADLFHRDLLGEPFRRSEETFLEQLVRLPSSLGISFERPELALAVRASDHDLVHRPASFLAAVKEALGHSKPANLTYSPFVAPATVSTLVELKARGEVLILVPQHLPKFHPSFDVVLRELLEAVPSASVVITYDVKKSMWRRTLETRWSKHAGFSSDMLRRRVLWMESLSPQQYLAVLALGDVMVDPFPFGGGVTTLEALAVCTPVVTLPALQNVPALTAGMLRALSPGDDSAEHVRNIFSSAADFVQGATRYLKDPAASLQARQAICRDAHNLYTGSAGAGLAVAEWAELLATASSPSAAEVMIPATSASAAANSSSSSSSSSAS